MIYLVLDRKKGTITYTRAGHCPILYYNPAVDKAVAIEDEGMGIGVVRDETFWRHIHVYERKIHSGDVYVMVTDGFEESELCGEGSTGRYGSHRLLKSLEDAPKATAEDVKDTMVSDFTGGVKGNENIDDLCMMVLRIR